MITNDSSQVNPIEVINDLNDGLYNHLCESIEKFNYRIKISNNGISFVLVDEYDNLIEYSNLSDIFQSFDLDKVTLFKSKYDDEFNNFINSLANIIRVDGVNSTYANSINIQSRLIIEKQLFYLYCDSQTTLLI